MKLLSQQFCLKLQDLSIVLNKRIILNNISLTFENRKNLSIMGPSGSGKTTLLKTIAGLISPNVGTIQLNKEQKCVMLWQSLALWPHLTVKEHLLLVRNNDLNTYQLNEILDNVSLAKHKNKKPAELSGGEKQRLALARALAVKPQCVLLDEPFSSLDIKLKMEMIDLIKNVQQEFNFSIIMATHNPIEALLVSKEMIALEQGRITFEGPIKQYIKNEQNPYHSWAKEWYNATAL